MQNFHENKRAFLKNENINISNKLIEKQLSLRKSFVNEKLLIKRLNYTNNKIDSILEISPNNLDLPENEKIFQINDLNEENTQILINLFESQNRDYVKLGVYAFRKFSLIIATSDNVIEIDKNIMNKLKELCIATKEKSILYELYWIFVNISINPSKEILKTFTDNRFFEAIGKHYSYNLVDVTTEIIWFLTHIVDSDSEELIKLIINSKLILEIFKEFSADNLDLIIVEKSLWFIDSLLQGTAQKIKMTEYFYLEIIRIVTAFIYVKNDKVLKLCLEIIKKLSDLESVFITKRISSTNLIAKLLKFDHLLLDLEVYLDKATDKDVYKIEFPKKILTLILHISGNLLAETENSEVVDAILDCNILDFFSKYYELEIDDCIQNKIVWACSNISANNKRVTARLVESQVFKQITNTLERIKNPKLFDEILFLIANTLSHNDSEICFSYFNYAILENIMDYLNNCLVKKGAYMTIIFSLNIFKNLFLSESNYKEFEQKNYNFDDNNINFVEFFIKRGGLEMINSIRIRNFDNHHLDSYIGELENQIKRRGYDL